MSRSVSDTWMPGADSHPSRSACCSCCHRKDCPYSHARILDNALRQAVSLGETAARLLTAEADRLHEAFSGTSSPSCLLHANESLEQTLNSLLHAELEMIERLSTP